MQPIIVSIDTEGTATYLINEYSRNAFPDAQEPRRASNVLPMSLPLRILFRALRGASSDDSRLAAWTRTWPCLWQVDLSPVGGPTYGGLYPREAAIECEIEWLNANFLGRR